MDTYALQSSSPSLTCLSWGFGLAWAVTTFVWIGFVSNLILWQLKLSFCNFQCEDVILDEMKCFKLTSLVLAITAEDRGWQQSL